MEGRCWQRLIDRKTALKNTDFSKFRERDEFCFLVNNNPIPDGEALQIGRTINESLFNEYLNLNKSKLGYGDNVKYSPLDNLDSRHYMMSCFITNYFRKNNLSLSNILEIGGGFGNWCYINESIMNFNKWTIIDFDFVISLQKWFLQKEMNDFDKILFVDTNNIDKISNDGGLYDIVICAHSLSETSKDNFDNYLKNILIDKTKYLFYGYHTTLPNENLIKYKKNKIDEYFDIVDSFSSQNNYVNNVLYRRKK